MLYFVINKNIFTVQNPDVSLKYLCLSGVPFTRELYAGECLFRYRPLHEARFELRRDPL